MFSYLFCRHSTTKYTLYEDFVRDPRAREQSDVYDFGFSNEMYYWVQVARECTGIKYKGRTGSMRKAETEKHEKKKERIRIKLRIFFFFLLLLFLFIYWTLAHVIAVIDFSLDARISIEFYLLFLPKQIGCFAQWNAESILSSNFLFLSTMFYEVFYVWKCFCCLETVSLTDSSTRRFQIFIHSSTSRVVHVARRNFAFPVNCRIRICNRADSFSSNFN